LGHFIGQRVDSILPQIHEYIGLGLLVIVLLISITAYFVLRSRKRVAGSRM
jgi:hypothetical protein